jgi:anti-sigma factor RsiW
MEYPSGWTCELVTMKIEYYLIGSLPLSEALAVAEHIEACAVCAETLVLWKPAGGGCRSGATDGSDARQGRRG